MRLHFRTPDSMLAQPPRSSRSIYVFQRSSWMQLRDVSRKKLPSRPSGWDIDSTLASNPHSTSPSSPRTLNQHLQQNPEFLQQFAQQLRAQVTHKVLHSVPAMLSNRLEPYDEETRQPNQGQRVKRLGTTYMPVLSGCKG